MLEPFDIHEGETGHTRRDGEGRPEAGKRRQGGVPCALVIGGGDLAVRIAGEVDYLLRRHHVARIVDIVSVSDRNPRLERLKAVIEAQPTRRRMKRGSAAEFALLISVQPDREPGEYLVRTGWLDLNNRLFVWQQLFVAIDGGKRGSDTSVEQRAGELIFERFIQSEP